jgi:hypothetical protein
VQAIPPQQYLVLVPILLLAASIYRPWEVTPFPVGDWGGLFPVLQGNDGFVSRYRALMDMYLQEGRYQPGFIARLAFFWAALGDNPLNWQLAGFGLMTANILAAYVFLRRLGANVLASMTSLILLVVSGMALQSWTLLQIPEPAGLLATLLACIAATSYQSAARPTLHAIAITGFLVAAILMKETYIIAVPFVLTLAMCVVSPGVYRWPALSRRNVVLVSIAIPVVIVCNVVPIVHVRVSAPESSYASRYQPAALAFDHMQNVFASMFLPVTRVPWFPPNAAFLAVLAVGFLAALTLRLGPTPLIAYAIGLSLPVLGGFLHLPWPATEGYYAAAVLPGLILVFALALTWISRHTSVALHLGATAAVVVILVYGALLARSYAVGYRAAREVESETATLLADYSHARELVVGVPSPATAGAFADGLRRYALARGVRTLPQGRDVTCDEASRLGASATKEIVVVVFIPSCDRRLFATTGDGRTVSRTYVSRDLRTLRARVAECAAHVWPGE